MNEATKFQKQQYAEWKKMSASQLAIEKEKLIKYRSQLPRISDKEIVTQDIQKLDSILKGKTESVNEAIDPKHLKKIIHNDATVTLGNASVEQLNASKRWYLDRVGHITVGERKTLQGVQKTYMKNLGLITKELTSRKKNEDVSIHESDEIDDIMKFYQKIDDRRFWEDLKKADKSLFTKIKDIILKRAKK